MHESERHGNGGAGGRGDEQQVGALALGVYTGLGPMAAGYALWTYAMSQPSAARLAPIAYATPLLSTLVLLASGERLGTLGLIGCGLIVACAADFARAMPAAEVAAAAEEVGVDVVVAKDVGDALQRVGEAAGTDDLILVTGSLYVVGEARRLLGVGSIRQR